MDRKKKSLYHNVTGRECGGSVRGLAELPWAVAEMPEEYFSGWVVPSEKRGV